MGARYSTSRAYAGVAIALAALSASPSPLEARQGFCLYDLSAADPCVEPPPHRETPRWMGHAVTFGVNAALGGLTAGIVQYARGESFWNGFLHGSAGGGLTYLGKRISGARFTGAGLLGREVAAVGSSMVRNSAYGREPFARLVLPVGPLRLHLDPAAPEPLRVKLDLGLGALVVDFPKLLIDYPDRPWEREAYFLDSREGDPW